jgi:hypothetical protein
MNRRSARPPDRPACRGDGSPRRVGPPTARGRRLRCVWLLVAAAAGAGTASFVSDAIGAGGGAAALDAPVRAIWKGLPLGAWTEPATRLAGRPVVLDRRIDPDTPVTLTCDGDPLDEVLDRVASLAGAAVEVLESSICLVPAAEAGRARGGESLRRREVAALAAAVRRRVENREAWHWPAGSRPRDLADAAARSAGFTLAGLEAVPHDHLPSRSLAPLSLAERLDLLLAQYDLRVSWLPEGPRLVPLGPAQPQVAGTPAPSRRPRRPTSAGREVFSLRLEAPLDAALAAVAARLSLTLEIDTASLAARGVLPGVIARAEVSDASRDELLDAIVRPLGLSWTIRDGRLRVYAP